MFNLIRIVAPLLALALVAWFVYEVFITGDAATALSSNAPIASPLRSA